MRRIALSLVLCAAALALGIATSLQAAENRARAEDLATRHHVCETLERQNQLRRVENERLEWAVLHGVDEHLAAGSGGPGPFEN